jgi:hypothetical protein
LRRTGKPWIENLDLGWDTLSESAPGHWSVTEYNTIPPWNVRIDSLVYPLPTMN